MGRRCPRRPTSLPCSAIASAWLSRALPLLYSAINANAEVSCASAPRCNAEAVRLAAVPERHVPTPSLSNTKLCCSYSGLCRRYPVRSPRISGLCRRIAFHRRACALSRNPSAGHCCAAATRPFAKPAALLCLANRCLAIQPRPCTPFRCFADAYATPPCRSHSWPRHAHA